MSTGLIGKKIGMTNIFDDDGNNFAVTVIEVHTCVVTQIKTDKVDGYESVQLSSVDRREKTVAKPQQGHFEKAGVKTKRYVCEFKGFDAGSMELGDELNIEDLFAVGESVDIVGTSKGKGFAGVMKRHGFHGVGDATHGQADRQRHSGSIGQASDPSRVFKGMKMPGHAGDERVTIKNLTVAKIFDESKLMMVTGSVPGAKGGMLEIYNR